MGSLRDGEAQASFSRSGGRVGSHPGGNHGSREAMGFVDHCVQSQHNAGNLLHPGPGGRTIKQASPEHIIDGPMAPLVDGVALRMVGGGQQLLDSQRTH